MVLAKVGPPYCGAKTPAEPARCSASARRSHAESSPASEMTVWHDTDNLAFRGVSTGFPWSLAQEQGELTKGSGHHLVFVQGATWM